MDLETVEKVYNGRATGIIGKQRFYSILVPFVIKDGTLSVLYEVRATGIRQPGEVCFPGGHIENDESPEECAVRETCEELGISGDKIKVFSAGDTLYGNGFTLYTFTGSIELPRDDASQDRIELADITSCFKPDPTEVSEIFTVPLDRLLETEPEHYGERFEPHIDKDFPYERVGIDKDYPWRTSEHDIPVYDIDGRIIWGITARITESVLATLKNH